LDLVGAVRRCTHILVLLISVFLSLSAFASEERSYRNEEYSFTLRYPSSFQVRSSGEGYFDILKDDEIFAQASVEDETFNIFIHEVKPKEDVFRSFARERCKIICDADGPDGSTYCKEIATEKEWTSANGLRVLEFTLVFTRENYQDKTKEESKIGPVYVVDISAVHRHVALMIHPEHEILASKDSEQLIRGLIDTIKLRPGNSDRQKEIKVCGATCKK
jgi:hypothetical protein